MLTFLCNLSVGMYLGLLIGLLMAALFAVAIRREEEPTSTATAPRLVELMHADATNYRRN